MRIVIAFAATNYPETTKTDDKILKISVTAMLLICQDRVIKMEFNFTWFFCASYCNCKFNPIFIILYWNILLINYF